MSGLDKRLYAYRPDLADERLKDRVEARRYVRGKPARIGIPVADMLASPDGAAGMNTQLLAGEDIMVFDEEGDWSWVQSEQDGYVGYIAREAIAPRDPQPTHTVSAPRTFAYPGPDLKFPRTACLSMGSMLQVTEFVENRGTRYALLPSGEAIVANHLRPITEHAEDYVTVAGQFLDTPYLWGGVSAFGIDCSGLVQLSMRMAGRRVPRDSDMQAAGIGRPFEPGANLSGLRRGDLVFWKGHVAIMTDNSNIVHANGHTMTVAFESLQSAVKRIAYLYGGPTGFRRP